MVVLYNAVFVLTVHATSASESGSSGISVTSVSDLNRKILCPVFDTMFWILMGVSIIMIMWAAFTYVRAQDDSTKVSQATKTITYAVVGIVVALVAKSVPNLVGTIFNVQGVNAC